MVAALVLSKVEFAYAQLPVLRGVDLEVESGSFFGLLGPNGAGKTTLLQIVCGALRPKTGNVLIQGRELTAWDRKTLAREVAVVPQRLEVAFPFTVLEMVLLGRVPHHGPLSLDSDKDLSIARTAMEATDVLTLAARRIHELSGGEQKRVMVAKALAQEPRLLLLDEPAAHLDIRHQVGLYQLIESIRRSSRITVISAMHDLNLAAAYCNQVALLQAGRVHSCGKIEDVMTYKKLKEVFETDIYVGVNEITGHRLFSPMPAHSGEKI